MTITIKMPVALAKAAQAATFSWKTTLIGLLSAVYAVFQAYSAQDTTFTALIHDQKFIMAVIVALGLFFAKDSTAHGTPSNPLPSEPPAPPAPPPVPPQASHN